MDIILVYASMLESTKEETVKFYEKVENAKISEQVASTGDQNIKS